MSTKAGQVFTTLTRSAFSRGILFNHVTSTVRRLNSARFLALTPPRTAKPKDVEKEIKYEPIQFSTSKASHKTWKVDSSLGSKHQRPWWKVLPISLLGICFLLWCAFREESDMDAQLNQHLYTHLPGLLSEEEEEQDKSS